jgi:hypothetical protein
MGAFAAFELNAVRASLDRVKEQFDWINERVYGRREKLTGEMVSNMVEAYDYLNGLLEKGIELFSPAGLYSMLELNHIVLCGRDPAKRAEYFTHVQETRKRFQENIKPIQEWYGKKGREQGPFKKASSFYVRMLSQPQLFLEGNHRTGNIILNYLLFNEDVPPFVLSVENALEYFNPSTKIKFSSKQNMFDNIAAVPGYEKEFRHMLEKYVDSKYVRERRAS